MHGGRPFRLHHTRLLPPSTEHTFRSSNHKVHHIPFDESDVAMDPDTEPEPDDRNRRRLDALETRRALAQDAERGVEAARLEDPDIDAKDGDVGLLQVWTSCFRLASRLSTTRATSV